MADITLSINGKNISCPSGTSILNAALENGIRVPTLCHHPHLEPVGACRLCLVEDEKTGRIMASCVTPVAPNMAIQTDSPSIKTHRNNIIRLMMANHPESCIVCSQGNRCELRQIAAELGVGQTDLYPMPHYTGLEEANPFIIRDLSKCILCGKCIRADHELVVVGAIDYNLRGFKSRPATVHEMPLEKSICTFCGTCVSMCPTGALSLKNTRYVGSPQKESLTVCGFCGVGCSLVMGSVDGQIVEVNPSHKEKTVNRSTLCVRGHFTHDYLNVSERLITPLIRKDGKLSPATWDEAFEVVAQGLISIKKKYGPQSVAFLGSSKCTIEENYLFQKMARVILGTNNVDNGSYGSGRPVINLINERLDNGGRTTPLADLEKAEVIFVMGADPTETVPVVGYYLKRASRINGIPLIVTDPRKTGLVPFSSLWLPLLPNSDVELINGLAALLLKRKADDSPFIDQFTEGFGPYRDGLSALDLERVCSVAGIEMRYLEQAVDLLKGKKITFVIGHGILQQKYGTSAMDALINLALMTGSLGRENRGFYFLARENNEIGALDMGTAPDFLPGRMPFNNDKNRKHWEKVWDVKLSPDPGLNLIRMIEETEKGTLKALFIMGENPLRSLPQPEHIRNALKNLELLVVQDILANETAHTAHVVLAGAAFSEKAGTFTNMEGRIRSFEPVVSPPGDARPDWEILDLLSKTMAQTDGYSSIQKIRTEISRRIPMYSELGKVGEESWIRETSNLKVFHPDGDGDSISFSPVIPMKDEKFDEAYPFTAILGSLRYHLGSGTRTCLSDRIKDFDLKGEVEISPEDGTQLKLKAGDKVRISSPYGAIERQVTLKKDLRPGLIFVPMALHNNDAMQLIGLSQLGEADSPGWNACRVTLKKIVI
ncbi:MAG: molybdopterin-dependent oxidoreductase [Desulfobacteraceae bacterium]|nr:MAG: molybdopterin-dependent oxidoreductase [Desulfobacteraceae bacterium]